MTIHEKLQELMKDRAVAKVARLANLNYSSLYGSIYRKSPVTTAVALKLARALGVDPVWLIDDARGLPVHYANQPTSATGAAA